MVIHGFGFVLSRRGQRRAAAMMQGYCFSHRADVCCLNKYNTKRSGAR